MSFKNKTKEQILEDAGKYDVVVKVDNTGGGIEIHEYERMAISVKCTQDIENAIDKLVLQIKASNQSSDQLSRKIYFLNWVLVGATVIIALCTVLSLFVTNN